MRSMFDDGHWNRTILQTKWDHTDQEMGVDRFRLAGGVCQAGGQSCPHSADHCCAALLFTQAASGR